jgi:hypothetical protein
MKLILVCSKKMFNWEKQIHNNIWIEIQSYKSKGKEIVEKGKIKTKLCTIGPTDTNSAHFPFFSTHAHGPEIFLWPTRGPVWAVVAPAHRVTPPCGSTSSFSRAFTHFPAMWGRTIRLPSTSGHRTGSTDSAGRARSSHASDRPSPPNRREVRNPRSHRTIKSGSQPFNPHRCSNRRERKRGREKEIAAAMCIGRGCVSGRGRKTWSIALSWGWCVCPHLAESAAKTCEFPRRRWYSAMDGASLWPGCSALQAGWETFSVEFTIVPSAGSTDTPRVYALESCPNLHQRWRHRAGRRRRRTWVGGRLVRPRAVG